MAETRVKSSLVLEACGKAMNIEATDADIEEEAEKIASSYGLKKEEFMERIKDNDQFIRDSIVGRKTVDALTASAKKVEAKDESKEEAKEEKPAKKTAKKTTKKAEKEAEASEEKTEE